MKTRVYGLFSDKYLRVLAELFKRFKYKRALIVHGVDGLDEISNVGPTKICELKDNKISEYTVTPGELGIKKAKVDDIKAESRQGNIIDFLRVLYGKEKGAKRDIVLVNAAAGFYVMGKVKNLAEGVKLAADVIDEGLAFKKLEALVDYFGGREKLEFWKKKI